MTLFTRCIFALLLYFTFVLSVGLQPAHAQGLPDLKEIQRLIDEARSIVAKAKECVDVADVADREAGIAGKEKGIAETQSDEASIDSNSAKDFADMVKTEKMKAEEAAALAKQAAMAAAEAQKEAAEAAEALAVSAAQRAATIAALQSVIEKLGTDESVSVDQANNELIQAALDAAQTAVMEANMAAARAENAANAANMAAAAANRAAGDAAIAGEEARIAVENAAEDAKAAAKAANDAKEAAEEAAKSANQARESLTSQRNISVARYVSDAANAAADARQQADLAATAAKNAGNYAMKAATAGTNAGAHAKDADDAAKRATAAAEDAEKYADKARSCAEEVSEREATLSSIRAASAYLSRTVVNRVQKLRPAGGSSFSRPARTSRGVTGLNAGDEALPDYPPNLAIDIGYSESSGGDLFEANSRYVLVMMDTLLTQQSLLGFGLGTEYTRESLLGGAQRRTQGLTATAYTAHILNKNFTLVPQAALTYLNKKKKFSLTPEDNEKSLRTLFSLTMLAQKQWGKLELSGFGQLAYTHETGGGATYLGQAIAGGECAYAVKGDARLFVGASMDYDIARSASERDKFGWEGKFGLRSPLGSSAELSMSVSTSRKDEEETTSGNVFVKIFF